MIEGKLKASDRLLRYMSFEKFMDIIVHKKIYIPRADSFDDGFEGSYTKLIYEISKGITIDSCNQGMRDNTARLRESSFVSCWTLSEFENMALWKLYGGNNSIAIETTVDALERELTEAANNQREMNLLTKRIVKVDYIDHNSIDDDLTTELLTKSRSPLKKKSKAYSYEQEIRIIMDHLDQPLAFNDIKNRFGAGVYLAVNVNNLVNKIYVSPLADTWFYNLLKSILEDYDMSELISRSNMFLTPADEVFIK